MPRNFVLTLTGPDRVGIVESVTGLLLDRGGNVETSRMARLGGEFAVLMLVSMPEDRCAGLDDDFSALKAQGYKVGTAPAERTHAEAHEGWAPYQIAVQGADHEGIIHEVARHLARHGISIEEMDSESAPAPTSGVPIFSMTARLLVPPGEAAEGWAKGLDEIGWRLNLEIDVTSPPDRE